VPGPVLFRGVVRRLEQQPHLVSERQRSRRIDGNVQDRPIRDRQEAPPRQGERYVRQLATLAFVSPRIIAAIVDGTAPADLTVTDLAKALPYSWAEQEQSIGLIQSDFEAAN